MGRGILIAASIAIGLAGSIAQAATVTSDGTDGLINNGHGFRKLTSGDKGNTGDYVRAGQKEVTVTFENGCMVVVKPGAQYAIETPEQCVANGTTFSPNGLIIAGAVAGGIAAAVIVANQGSGGASP